jgi:SAM-dependent methyltransferase
MTSDSFCAMDGWMCGYNVQRVIDPAMASNPLKSHIRDWQEMASADPLRAISGQRKHWTFEEFLATAKPHMEQLFSVMEGLDLPRTFDCALEFGCGAGRFLCHLEKRFGEVWGVDVSEDMLRLARRYNPSCRFHLNTTAGLEVFPNSRFDLVYSFLVLQHLPAPPLIVNYIKEFLRILKPGGLAAFQIPDHLSMRWRIQPRRRMYQLLRNLGINGERLQSWNLLPMRLTAVSEKIVESAVSEVGGKVVRIDFLGRPEGAMYYCTK